MPDASPCTSSDLSFPACRLVCHLGPEPVAAVTGRQLLLQPLFACMIAPRAPALMSATSRSHTAPSPRGTARPLTVVWCSASNSSSRWMATARPLQRLGRGLCCVGACHAMPIRGHQRVTSYLLQFCPTSSRAERCIIEQLPEVTCQEILLLSVDSSYQRLPRIEAPR